MKKLVFAAVLCAALWSCAPGKFGIDGELKNADGAKVMLFRMDFSSSEVLDSAVVSGGRFELGGSLEAPSMCRLVVLTGAEGDIAFQGSPAEALVADFYMDNSDVTFSADAQTMQSYYWSSGRTVEEPVVKGSVQQDFKKALDAARKEVYDSLVVVGGRISSEYYGSVSGDMKVGAELAGLEMSLMDEYYGITFDFVKENPQAAVSFDEISFLFGQGGVSRYSAEQIVEFVAVLEPHWKGTAKFGALKEAAQKAAGLSLGQKFIDAEFKTLDGQTVLLSSVIPQGRIVMLEFWASWCGPCRGEIPHLKKVREEYPQFDIVSISVDDSEEAWKKAVADEGMDWVQLKDSGFDGGKAMELYGVTGVPCCIILDEQGRFLKTDMRGPWLDAFLMDYYSEK